MKNIFTYSEKEGWTTILARIGNIKQIRCLLEEMTEYILENLKYQIDKINIFYFNFERVDDNNQIIETIHKEVFFEQIVKEYPEIRPQVLAYVESIPVDKLEKETYVGIDAMIALALVDSIYYKDFEQFFKRMTVFDEDNYKTELFLDGINRIFETQKCDKAMMEFMTGLDELFSYEYEFIELPENISRELFDYLMKIYLEKMKGSISDDIMDLPYYIKVVFGKIPHYKSLYSYSNTSVKERFKKDIQSGNIPTYGSLSGTNPVFYSIDDKGLKIIVDIEKEEEVKVVIELLTEFLLEENMANIAYDFEFGKLTEDDNFEIIYCEDDFLFYVIEQYPNLQELIKSYAFVLTTQIGDTNDGLPEGIHIITELAKNNKKYIETFGAFLLERDLNHPSVGCQETEYIWDVLTDWEWCDETINLAADFFCAPTNWEPESCIPIDSEIKPEMFDLFIKKICDDKMALHEREAMVYDGEIKNEANHMMYFYGLDEILLNVFENQDKEDLCDKFNKAIEQNCYPTYYFFNTGKMK